MSDNLPAIPDPWAQRKDESSADYTAFAEYCKLGRRRNYRLLASHLGMGVERIRAIAKRFEWNERADLYDRACNELVAEAPDLEDTLAFQYAVGKAMLDLGVEALKFKNPASMRSADIIKLLKEGADMQRRAAGLNDTVTINVQSEAVSKINTLLDELGVIEGEAVEDE